MSRPEYAGIFTCFVSFQVGWMKADDQTILTLHTRVITHNPRISVTHDDDLRTWQLHIRQLKETDRGCYMCQINTGAMKKTLGCVDVQGIKQKLHIPCANILPFIVQNAELDSIIEAYPLSGSIKFPTQCSSGFSNTPSILFLFLPK